MKRTDIKIHHHYRTSKPVWGSARVRVDSTTATSTDSDGAPFVGVKVEYMGETVGLKVLYSVGRVVKAETIEGLWNPTPYPFYKGQPVRVLGPHPSVGVVTDTMGGHWDSPLMAQFDGLSDESKVHTYQIEGLDIVAAQGIADECRSRGWASLLIADEHVDVNEIVDDHMQRAGLGLAGDNVDMANHVYALAGEMLRVESRTR